LSIEKKTNEEIGELLNINIQLKSTLSTKEIQNNIQNIKEKLQETYQKTVNFRISTIEISEIIVQ
jgi:hypothetical protein